MPFPPPPPPPAIVQQVDIKAHQFSEYGSERATSSFGNRIVTLGDKVHVVWQDAREPSPDSGIDHAHYRKPHADYPAQVRTFDRRSGTWGPTVTLGMGQDNHGRPTIIADSQGYLHVMLGGHHTAMRHFRSQNPNDSSKWELVEEFGMNTYPVMSCGPDDTLYLLARHDDGWQGAELYIRRPGKSWQSQGLLVTREAKHVGYGAFHGAMAIDADGVIHYVCDFYESRTVKRNRGLKQAVATMQSHDGGRSWQRADGTPVEIPAKPEDMDTLELYRSKRSHEPMALVMSQGSIALDSKGRPYIFYISHLREAGEMIIATPDETGTWQKRTIDPALTGFPEHRAIGQCRGRFVITADDRMYVILTIYPLKHRGWNDGQPTEKLKHPDSPTPVVELVSEDFGESWAARRVMPPVEEGLIQELNMERGSVHHPIVDRSPAYIFFDGPLRYPRGKEVIQTNVYFVGDRPEIQRTD